MARRGVAVWVTASSLFGLVPGCAPERPAAAASAHRAAAAPEAGAYVAPGPAPESNQGAVDGRKAVAVQRGQATYYGDSLAGHKTASGERYDPRRLTAAHRQLPLGTVVRVVRVDTGAVVVVRITDRGPFGSRRRIIDLSRAAAEQLHMIRAGVAEVRLEVLEYGRTRKKKKA
jgi:rare lipoprotein A